MLGHQEAAATMTEAWLELEAHEIGDAAPGVRLLDLRAPGGGELPGFAAGAHVDVAVDAALVRQYSLCNDPRERHRYLHERVAKGSRMRVGLPRNLFPLADARGHSVLVAGGIGITPLWAMAQSLEAAGTSWELHYAARSREHAALLETIRAFAARSRCGVLHCYFSRERPSRRIDLPALLQAGRRGRISTAAPRQACWRISRPPRRRCRPRRCTWNVSSPPRARRPRATTGWCWRAAG
jgi:ferredoxin-NADP reductase